MTKINHYQSSREKRRKRVRSKLFGTSERPRLSVFRSNHHLALQVIDDEKGKTIVSSTDLGKENPLNKGAKMERAKAVAEDLAKKLKAKKIGKLVFDRGQYRYHGRVKTVAEAIRAAGLEV